MEKIKKAVYVPQEGITKDAVDYSYFYMNKATRCLCFLAGMAVGFCVGYIFYESIILSALLGCICGFALQPLYHNYYISKRKKDLTIQFKDMLEALSTSIGAGSNVQESFLAAYKDMTVQYTEDSYIAKELRIIHFGLDNNFPIEAILENFGKRSGISDINSFANVFETCNRKGGNIKEVIRNTYQMISDKIEIELEIKTVVASKTSEQNMMLVMPVVLVLMLKGLAGDIINLNSAVGRISTTVAMVLFAAAYLIGRKILTIKV